MRRWIILLASTLEMFLWACSTAHATPPRVVHAVPNNGDTNVDPLLREIRVVFDQPMNRTAGWSIVGGGPTFPKLSGKPRWLDDQTISIPVKLEPDHDYWLSINSQNFRNFIGQNGEPAEPYPISFTTAPAKGKSPTTIPTEKNQLAIEHLRYAIDNHYSYRDLHGIDWHKRIDEFQPGLLAAKTPREFAKLAGELLSPAKDMHVVVQAGTSVFPTHRPNAPTNFNARLLPELVSDYQGDHVVGYGKLDASTGYILVSTWERNRLEKALHRAFDALTKFNDLPAIVIDVRPNSGGDETLAQQFAGCFIDKPVIYSRNTIRLDGKWLGPYDRILEPNTARPRYRGRVVVLMGPQNMSSCESFLLMMRQVPGCKLVGDKSYGSSGNPKPVELENGVTVLLPSWKDMLPDGTLLEGNGVTPDVTIRTEAKQLLTCDPVLEQAMKLQKSPAP